MSSATYDCQRGSTIAFEIDAMTGDPTGASCTAKIRKLATGARVLDPAAVVAATLTVTPRAAVGDIPAGWTLTLPAAASDGLTPGHYLADARVTIGSEVITTESWVINLTEPATRP